MSDIETNNAALSAIKYALDNRYEEPIEFLRLWFEGEFDILRNEWDYIPDEVFIGADTLFVPKDKT